MTQSSTPVTALSPSLGQDMQALGAANALNSALQQTPAVRPEKVAQAQNLINDNAYPPDAVIDGFIKLLGASVNGPKVSNSPS